MRAVALTIPAPPARAEPAPRNPKLASAVIETTRMALDTGTTATAASLDEAE